MRIETDMILPLALGAKRPADWRTSRGACSYLTVTLSGALLLLPDLVPRLATRQKRGLNGFVADYIAGNQQTAIRIINEIGSPGA